MHRPRALAVVLFAAVAAAPLRAQDNSKPLPTPHVLLRLQFRPGTSQWYRDMMDVVTSGGVEMHLELTREARVLPSASLGGASIEQTTRRVVLHGKQPLAVDYDSDVPGSPTGQATPLVAAVGSVVSYRRDDRGRLSDYRKPDFATGQLSEFVGCDGDNAAFGGCLELPDGPVAVGANWSHAAVLKMGGAECKVDVTCRLARVDGGRVTIEWTAKIDTDEVLAALRQLDSKLGAMSGDTVIDLASGRLLQTNSKLLLSTLGGERTVTTHSEAIEPPSAKPAPKAPTPADTGKERRGPRAGS